MLSRGTFAVPVLLLATLSGCSSDSPAAGDDARPVTATIHADFPVYESAEELSEAADTVVRGIVRSSVTDFVPLVPTDSDDDDPMSNPQAGLSEAEKAAFLAEGHGYVATMHTIEVTEVLKGSVAVGDTVTVEQLGGLQDGVRYVTEGLEQLAPGHEYVLVGSAQTGDQLSLVNLDQSIYSVDERGALSPTTEDPDGYVLEGSLSEAEQVFSE